MPCTEDVIPRVDLPVAIDIIKDIREHDGKSTAVHAKVIGKDFVTIYDQPGDMIPDYSKFSGKTFLVFPDDDAISIPEAFPRGDYLSLKTKTFSWASKIFPLHIKEKVG